MQRHPVYFSKIRDAHKTCAGSMRISYFEKCGMKHQQKL
jgi:hypothetical protein